MKNHFEIPLTLSLFLFTTVILSGQTTKRSFAISGDFLTTIDFTRQSPDAGKAFQVEYPGYSPAFGVLFECPIKNDFWFGAGYRYKQHWIGWASGMSESHSWIGAVHSLNLKITWKKNLGGSPMLDRLTLDCSGGFLINKAEYTLTGGSSASAISANGIILYTASTMFGNDDTNHRKASVSLDGTVKMNYNLPKNFQVYLGYGYTKGFWALAKGNYTYVTAGGVVDSGTITNMGSYKYIVLGARMLFRKTGK